MTRENRQTYFPAVISARALLSQSCLPVPLQTTAMSPASSVSSSDTAVDEPSHQSYSRLGMISPRRAVSALTQSVYSLILALVQIGYNIYQSIVSLIFTVVRSLLPERESLAR